ncbi:MAG: heme A synthase, partial [Acidimicrobiaceae bacterium]|nr:heme A synthase [Acidimicrobiaceae bacterium]
MRGPYDSQRGIRHHRFRLLGLYHRCVAPPAYARLTRFALWALAAIVVTGVSVRLTGSGLGCEDWPTCSEDRFVADLEYHALVEFVNRLFTGVVAIAVIGAVLGSWRRRPRRTDLIVLSLGLVAGVLAQVGLGALLVLSELDPRFTMGHFLLSMVLLWNAAVLDVRARSDFESAGAAGRPRGSPGERPTDGTTRLMLWAVLVVGGALLVTGTLVTGAGPHAGDSRAERLPLLVREVARIHSIVALILLGMVVWTWWRLRASGSAGHVRMGRIAVLLVVQGAVGYTQYFTGVPVLLVGIHVALASITWIEIVKAAH